MQTQKHLNIGFIGCGSWARKKYLPWLSKNLRTQVVAMTLIRSDEEKKQIRDIVGAVNFYSTARKMITQQKKLRQPLDGVIVSLPHALYFTNIKTALEHKIPVLADKPAVCSSGQLNILLDISNKNNTPFLIASQRRVYPNIIKASQLITQKHLGHINWMRSEFTVSPYQSWTKTWRNQPSLSGLAKYRQGMMLDAGFHCLDTILMLNNYQLPQTVFAVANNFQSQVDVDTTAILDFGQNTFATILVSRNMPPNFSREVLSISGHQGYFLSQIEEINYRKSAKMHLVDHQGSTRNINFNLTSCARVPLVEFTKYLTHKTNNSVFTANQMIKTIRVMDAIYRSIITRQRIKFSP